jgi:uncharacterized protein (TIRG00374 family)
MHKRWQFWLGLALSAAFLYYALSKLQLQEVWVYVKTARYWWILPGVAVYFFGVWARTWRWHYMLRAIKPIPLYRLFPVVCIGYMGNNIYPARIGELLRAYVLKRTEGISVSASLATIIVERIFDGVVMLLFVFIGLPLVPAIPDSLRQFVIMFSLLFFGALAIFFVIAASPQRSQAVYTWFIDHLVPARFREPVHGFADRFMEGLYFLRSGRDVAMIFITSLVVWLAETCKYWFVMHAFHFSVSFFVLMLMNGVVNLFTTIPSADQNPGDVWGRSRGGRRLHPRPARRALAADHAARRLLHVAQEPVVAGPEPGRPDQGHGIPSQPSATVNVGWAFQPGDSPPGC